MIYYLPLEHLDKRYTALMDRQLEREFKKQKKQFIKIDGDLLTTEIETGAFLDSAGTNYFKFSQLQKVCRLFKEKKIKDGDVFFISDLWFPGIEAIKYMAYFAGITVKIKGFLHAGSFTETDFVRGLEDWAKYVEKGWFKMFDTIYLGSTFIKSELIAKGRVIDFKKLKVLGLPFSTEDLYKQVKPLPFKKKENIVVFAGRLDDEKQPWQFDELARRFAGTGVKFVKTMELKLSKKDYLKLLAKSKVFFSSALQENFGYSALEASAYNLSLVLPNRLVYPEFYGVNNCYNDLDEAYNMIAEGLEEESKTDFYAKKHDTNIEKIVKDI